MIKKYTRVILNIVIPIAIIYLVCIYGPKLLGFFMPFVIGFCISLIANPLVNLLERKLKLVRKHSSVIIVILVLSLIIVGGYFLTVRVFIEIRSFIQDIPEIFELISQEVAPALAKLGTFLELLPEDFQNILNNFYENISEYVSEAVQKIGMPTFQVAGNVAMKIPNILISLIFIILSSYFFIADREFLVKISKRILPDSVNQKMGYLYQRLKHIALGYIMSQLKIMIVVAAILFFGMVILKVNYALLVAFLIAFLDFLPLFGTGTVLLPWAVLKLLSGEYYMAAGLLIIYVATQGIRQVIQPKIVGDAMGLKPLVTLLLLYLGYKYSGISGMVLSVPLGLIAIELYKAGIFDSLIKNVKIIIEDINDFRIGKK